MKSNPSAIIALRGWHPAISRAEAKAMFSSSKIERTEARRLLIANGESDWGNAHRMSGCECVLVGGGITNLNWIEELLSNFAVRDLESMAVECWRHEGKLPVATRDIERHLGGGPRCWLNI